MTIKNIRQFNSILSSVADVEKNYTNLLTFAVSNMEKHGNKDPLLSLLNAPFLRTKQGKVKASYKPLIRWIQAACPALTIGQRADNKVSRFTAENLPLVIAGNNVIFDAQKSAGVLPYTEWLEAQAAEKSESTPSDSVSVSSIVKYINSKLELRITAANIGELDALASAAKELLAACAGIELPQVDATRMDELDDVKPSSASKSAGKKKPA